MAVCCNNNYVIFRLKHLHL